MTQSLTYNGPAFSELWEKSIDRVPEPLRSTTGYLLWNLINPDLDKKICEQVGKIVIILARFKETPQEVGIRGEAPLNWNKDKDADSISPINEGKSFTLLIPPDKIDQSFEFKLVNDPKGRMQWQKGPNVHVDLSKYGHIAIIDINDVQFE